MLVIKKWEWKTCTYVFYQGSERGGKKNGFLVNLTELEHWNIKSSVFAFYMLDFLTLRQRTDYELPLETNKKSKSKIIA